MSPRTTDLFLTLLGTLLVILTLVSVLSIPVFASLTAVAVPGGEVKTGRLVLGTLGFLALAIGSAAGAWAVRRVLKRRETAARR